MPSRPRRARGLPTIAPSGVQADQPDVADDELFARLWASPDPRLRDAGTALLVVRPDLAGAAAAAFRRVTGDGRARADRPREAVAPGRRRAGARRSRRPAGAGADAGAPVRRKESVAVGGRRRGRGDVGADARSAR